MTLSIVIPTYNAESTIAEAIESIFASDIDVEVIVQDGGSTDGTLDAVSAFGTKVHCYSEVDSGQSQAINRAISRASGSLIGWLNADDLYCPGGLAAVIDAAQRWPTADVFFGDYGIARSNGQVFRRYHVQPWSWERFFSHGCYVWSGAAFFRREVFRNFGGIDENLHYCMDLEFMLRIGAHVRAVHVPAVVGTYRVNDQAKSSAAPWGFVVEAHKVLWRYSSGSPRLRLNAVKSVVAKSAYLCTKRFWHSAAWGRVRHEKHI